MYVCKIVDTDDYIFPANDFETVFYEGNRIDTTQYDVVCYSVQRVIKAKEYLASNPRQKVKMFFYIPSVMERNSADLKWILFLKK
jgi:hypothetical protein